MEYIDCYDDKRKKLIDCTMSHSCIRFIFSHVREKEKDSLKIYVALSFRN